MGYRLICIDMDGTLFNSQRRITETTRASLRQVRDLGVHVVISTGRTYADAAYYAELIGTESVVIAANGAYIREKGGGKVIYQQALTEPLIRMILEICDRYRASFSLYTPWKEYYRDTFPRLLRGLFRLPRRRRGQIRIAAREAVSTREQWASVISREQDQLLKCVIFHRNQAKLRRIRDELARTGGLEVASSGWDNIELTCQGVSKGHGVALLARYYNLRQEEIMAIGDGENDLAMIQYAGLGVAMGNASAIVKGQADYITDTNDRDGVAKAIQRFVLDGPPPGASAPG
ncbi:hypothetical protein EDC14_10075 [Hydrogenispora ethanolica]|uniref:Cof subfamily protein (Haloacid dehalogenase superfamily)/HAD superfamily hydrolase (TIGR01484 family) n=1 Tax=Hydrogenispora ethanolica TaxID=1082276 RepID=A0A4R1RXR8_HYDET|nr:Cof-type HAD-IIB family hydrolase [Hydrogenispora ethanolica]TCL71543.1 hypothetical protein EDC14_10075 [Hydrogenispora ethanolica]